MTKQNQLEELAQKLQKDNPTPLLAKDAKNMVFGSGNASAEIVFVGEAPGAKEDALGQPFVGSSGKILDEMLLSIGVNRSDVYITNIVKYRPLNNRDPSPEEKAKFWPYLLEQINIIRPKVVVTLGRHSGQVFKQDLRIGVDHGKPQKLELQSSPSEKFFVTFVPFYHPAATIYNRSLRSIFQMDFMNLPEIIKTRN
jgi:DNA polymerase